MIRVGFPVSGGPGWLGGRNYLLNLFRALDRHARDRIRPVALVPLGCDEETIHEISESAEVVMQEAGETRSRGRRWLRGVIIGRDASFDRWTERHRIGVLFENADFFGWRCRTPILAWIPDFQHRHLPGMFDRRSWWQRELGVRAQVYAGRMVMLSSESARHDCETFYPAARGHTCVVRFAVRPPASTVPTQVLRGRYGLPERFIYLPNQFWRHKNHIVVVEAVARLRQKGADVTVVASGSLEDPRSPGHYAALLRRIEELGLRERFRILGLIPYADVLGLIASSRAVLNPSRFEGWSTTVEEARGFGIPVILSAIPVHREQAAGAAEFFDPDSPEQLAALLERAMAEPREPDEAGRSAARRIAEERHREFALAFAAAVELTIQRRHNT